MRRIFALLVGLLFTLPALAWNSAGHRLSAVIAWQFMAPETRRFVERTLKDHPDHSNWVAKSGTGEAVLIFAEAANWPDSIRQDPRFYDAEREPPTPPVAGLPDNARHRDWHYTDFDRHGRRGRGHIDRQIEILAQSIRSTENAQEITWALPWLTHLIGDLHQPLHAGRAEDRGGNEIDIIDTDKPDRAPINLHRWWDDLPGSSSLRGERLKQRAETLMAEHLPPPQGSVGLWLAESRQLLEEAYPDRQRDGVWLVEPEFKARAQRSARRQLLAAGFRLARQLDAIVEARVSRGTR